MGARLRFRFGLALRNLLRVAAFIVLACTGFAWLTVVFLQVQEWAQPTRKPNATSTVNRPQPSAASLPAQAESMVERMLAVKTMSMERFHVEIAPNTPVRDLLPPAPSVHNATLVAVNNLNAVPEVQLQRLPPRRLSVREAKEQTALMIAKINLLNQKKPEGFLLALCAARPDLAGLPFVMGNACRTTGEQSRQFAAAVATVRAALQQQISMSMQEVIQAMREPRQIGSPSAKTFWQRFKNACAEQNKHLARNKLADRDLVTLARIRALMQMLAAEPPSMRLGLVRYLSALAHTEATRALARLAIFSPEDEVRQAALVALQSRPERDYADVLQHGLRYPWPAVASHAAEAIVKLERRDLVPQLVALLDEPDPRAPFVQQTHGKTTLTVRELVRLNHHRSCLLCHEPGNTATGSGGPPQLGTMSSEPLTAEVPVPGEPLPTISEGYQPSSPDLLVRVDVTYLRPDFSVLQPVADAKPWPKRQRFDFMVRTRSLTAKQADAYRKGLAASTSKQPSPYQQLARVALRELTGKNAAPTAEAWRRVLRQ